MGIFGKPPIPANTYAIYNTSATTQRDVVMYVLLRRGVMADNTHMPIACVCMVLVFH